MTICNREGGHVGIRKIRSFPLEVLLDIPFMFAFFECIRESNATKNFLLFFGLCVLSVFVKLFIVKKVPFRIFKPNIYFTYKGMFILCGTVLVYSGKALYPDVSLDMVRLLLIDIVFLYIVYLHFRLKKNIDEILNEICAWLIILLTYALLHHLFFGTGMRLGKSIGYNANTMAISGVYCAVFTYKKYLLTRKKSHLLVVAYLLLIIVLTGSRKGILGFVFCLLLISFMMAKSHTKWVRLVSIGMMLFVMYGLIMYVPVLYSSIGYRIENLLSFLSTGQTEEGSLESRISLIEAALRGIQEQPLFGYGLNAFRYYDHRGLYTHSNYIELLFSGGIVLLVVFYLLQIWLLVKSFRLYKQTKQKVMMAIVFSISILMLINDIAMVSYYSKLGMIIQLMLVCAVNTVTQESNDIVEYHTEEDSTE